MRANIHNFSMAYEDVGEGHPILLIHGFPFNREMWRPQIEALSQNYRVLAPDLRGFGDSEAVPGPYWMDALADDCAGLFYEADIEEPVVVCGLSMGGYIAMALFRQHSPQLRGMILAATRAGADSPEARQRRDKMAEKARQEGVEAVVEDMLPNVLAPGTYQDNHDLVDFVERMMKRTSLEGMVGALIGMKERPDSTITLQDNYLPTLILQGEDDQILGREEAKYMDENLSHSHLTYLPDAGHLLNLEQPDLFNQEILRYMEELENREKNGE